MSANRRNYFKELWARFGNERTAIVVIVISILMVTLDRGYYWWLHPLSQAPDQSLYLDTAKWILEGKVPYRDFFDWNPPLIMFLSMLPHMVSNALPLHPITSLNLLIIFSTFVSACASLYIAYRYLSRDDFFVFVPMCVGAIFLILEQQFDMAEREQMFVIVYLPFMVIRYAIWTRPGIKIFGPLAFITGLVAGLGLALKPQFVLAAAAFEFVLLLRNGKLLKRLIRPEVFGVLLVMLAYAGYLYFLLPKEAWDVLKNEIMPLFVYGYEYSSKGLMFMLHGGPYFYLPITILCYAMAVALFTNRFSQWAAPLAAFTLTGLFNYLHGDQAWIYRMIPMVAGCYLLCGLAIGLIGKYLYYHSRAPKAVATCLTASVFLTASIYTCWDLNYTVEDLKRCTHFHDLHPIGDYVGRTACSPILDLSNIFMVVARYTKAGDSVLYLGTGINDGYPAMVQSGRRCATRYPFCPLIVIDHCILSRPEAEKQKWVQLMYKQIEDYRKDIQRDQPDLILILDYPPFTDMLQRYGFFDRCMAGYRKYTKEFDVLVYAPEWNWPKDLPVIDSPAAIPAVPPTTGTATAKETEPDPYPDLPKVPPVTKADTEPPDEIVVPPPPPPKPPQRPNKPAKKKTKPATNLDLPFLQPAKPKEEINPAEIKPAETEPAEPPLPQTPEELEEALPGLPQTPEELERALPTLQNLPKPTKTPELSLPLTLP